MRYGLPPAVVLASAFVAITYLSIEKNQVDDQRGRDAASSELAGRASVIDGDTLEIHGRRIRLHGIDAPESRQLCLDGGHRGYRCGQKAAIALSDKIGRQLVSCEPRDVDRYGRIVAVCRIGDEDLNGWLVSQGWATVYRRYSTDYAAHENTARASKTGIWAGEFTPPEQWRREGRAVSATETGNDPSCTIKGNISRSGERIYHLPGGTFYSRTRINASKGERMFCTEAEARAAGWRRSRR